MNANRTHANTPSRYTPADRARMAAAIARTERENAARIRGERIKAFAAVTLVVGMVYTFGPAIIAAGMGAANAVGVL